MQRVLASEINGEAGAAFVIGPVDWSGWNVTSQPDSAS
jgi:hypothetical protein